MTRHVMLNNIAHKDLRVATRYAAEFGDNVGTNSVGTVITVATLSPNSAPRRVITRRSLCAMLLSITCLVIATSDFPDLK